MSSAWLFDDIVISVSSAYMLALKCSRQCSKSFKKMIKNSGPNHEPWGIPHGEILAIFQRSGKVPCHEELLKIIVSGLQIKSVASFKITVGILSGPADIPCFRLWIYSIKLSH